MKIYDWLIVGGGLTGSALGYELAVAGFSVLLIEQHQYLQGATRYSYGGIPHWSGTTNLTSQLAKAGLDRYRQLSAELDSDIEFRQIDLLLTIAPNANPQSSCAQYNHFATQPQLLDVNLACELEPMLNPDEISGGLHYDHAHVNPELLVKAYQSGLIARGGEICIDQVTDLHQQSVSTVKSTYYAENIVVCAGGIGRSLLKNSGISLQLYFTHAQVIETAPSNLSLRAMVMPAMTSRLALESEVSDNDQAWHQSDRSLLAPSIDVGAIQFKNRQLRLGQISQVHTNPHLVQDLQASEASIRSQVGKILPAIASIPGSCHHCLVAFSPDSLPLVGSVTDHIHIFSGFTSPFLYVPTLAQRFALSVSGNPDPLIAQLSPHRFSGLLQ